MSDFLNDQYQLPPAVFPPPSIGVPAPAVSQPAGAVVPPRPIVSVFDTRPKNAQDIYREFLNSINFTVPQGFTFLLRRIEAASYKDSAATVPVDVESGLRLGVTVNGVNTLLTDTNYGFASNFDAPVFIAIPETQTLGGYVTAKGPLLIGSFNVWQLTTPQPTGAVAWGRTAYAPGQAMTIQSSGSSAMLTVDGVNFSQVALPHTAQDIAYYGGVWIFSSDSTNQVFISPNGINWTTVAFPASPDAVGGGGNNMLLVAGHGTGLIYYSQNGGYSWTAGSAIAGLSGFVSRILYNPDAGVFVAYTTGGQVYSSSDGINWTLKFTGAVPSFNVMEYGGGAYIAQFGNSLYRSTDLVNWALVLTVSLGIPTYGSGVKYSNGVWKTTANNAHSSYTSTDGGITWTASYDPSLQSGSIGAISDTFYELTYQGGVNTGYYYVVKNAAQVAQGNMTMKFSISGQLIPNNAMPANTAGA